jgi:type I restriction enzyme S subunit
MSAGGQDQMHGSKKDVARANLSLEDVRGFRVPKPKMDEQQEIVAILDAIDRKIALHKEKRAVLEALFKSLLHKLMTGEVRVADLNLDALGGAAEAA